MRWEPRIDRLGGKRATYCSKLTLSCIVRLYVYIYIYIYKKNLYMFCFIAEGHIVIKL